MSLFSKSVKRSFKQSPNYTRGNRSLARINKLLIHWWNVPSAGATHGGVVSWFCNRSAKVSAHYVVSAAKVTQQVKEKDIAWHAGPANPDSIGLELSPYCTAGDYQTAAETIADIWDRAGRAIPLEPHRQHMQTACPGNWDLSKLYRMAMAIYRADKPVAVKPASTGTKSSTKPWAPGKGPWPTSYLTVVSKHTAYTHKAWVKLLSDVGYKGTVAQMLQRHLKKKGYYRGLITARSKVGPVTTRALQKFLKDRGHYHGRVDGSRGPQTVQAEIRFLNWNAEQYWK